MTNEEIKALRARVETDELLNKEEQLHLLQQLFRANRRIQAAVKEGFNTDPALDEPAASTKTPAKAPVKVVPIKPPVRR